MVRETIELAESLAARGDPNAILVLASLFRDETPWMYELSLELFRATREGRKGAAVRALHTFRQATERYAFRTDTPVDFFELYMILERIVERIPVRKPVRPTNIPENEMMPKPDPSPSGVSENGDE